MEIPAGGVLFIVLLKPTLCQYSQCVAAHSVKFKYSLSQTSLRTRCCQTATMNHALFSFVCSGTESGGVSDGGGGNR